MELETILQNISLSYHEQEPNISKIEIGQRGDICALNGRKGVYIINLDQPWEIESKLKLKKQFNYELGSVSFSQEGSPYALAGSSPIANFSAYINFWNRTESGWVYMHQLAAHKRLITDLQYSYNDAAFLCSCSAEGTINLWDTRKLHKAAGTTKFPLATASFVRWNKKDSLLLLSAHEGRACVWDLRKFSNPLSQYFASTQTLTDINWSTVDKSQFLTCDNSSKVKIWSVKNTSNICSIDNTNNTRLSTALYTPFGEALVTACSSTNSLYYYDMKHLSSLNAPPLIHKASCSGPSMMRFRQQGQKDSEEYQLLVLTQESHLLMLSQDGLLEKCHHNLTAKQQNRLKGAPIVEADDTPEVNQLDLEHEVRHMVDKKIMGLEFNLEKLKERELVVVFYADMNETEKALSIKIFFPWIYPFAQPSFQIIFNETKRSDADIKRELVKTAEEKSRTNENCLEECITAVVHNTLVSTGYGKRKPSAHSGALRPHFNHQDTTFLKEQSAPNLTSPSEKPTINSRLQQLGAGYITYLVTPKDTLGTIAMAHNMSLIQLRELNHIRHSAQLNPGSLLVVKMRESSPSPTPEKKQQDPNLPVTSLPSASSNSDEFSAASNKRRTLSTESFNAAKSPSKSHSDTHVVPPLSSVSPVLAMPSSSAMTSSDGSAPTLTVSTPSTKELTTPSKLTPTASAATSPDLRRNSMNSVTTSAKELSRTSPASGSKPGTPKEIRFGKSFQEVGERDFVKEKVEYIPSDHLPGQIVSGLLTITPRLFIFEPSLEDANVKLYGLTKLTVTLDILDIIDCSYQKRVLHDGEKGTLIVSAKGLPMQDMRQKSASKLTGSAKKDDSQEIQLNPLNLKEDLHNKFYYFIGRKERMQFLQTLLQSRASNKRISSFYDALNIDSTSSSLDLATSPLSGSTRARGESCSVVIAKPTNSSASLNLSTSGSPSSLGANNTNAPKSPPKTPSSGMTPSPSRRQASVKWWKPRPNVVTSSGASPGTGSSAHLNAKVAEKRSTDEMKKIEEQEKKGTFLKETKKIEIIDCYEAADAKKVPSVVLRQSDEFDMRAIIQESYRKGLNGLPPDEEDSKCNQHHSLDLGCHLLHDSKLIGHDEFTQIRLALPQRFHDYNWKRVFSTCVDGTSLTTFFSRTQDQGPTVLLIGDTLGHVFGGFVSEEWRHSGNDYFGDGECFVFRVKPNFVAYYWTGANEYYVMANKQFIAMGGGNNGRFAVYLDSELYWGTSERCSTYLNSNLSNDVEFYCTVAEVWAFTFDETAEEADEAMRYA